MNQSNPKFSEGMAQAVAEALAGKEVSLPAGSPVVWQDYALLVVKGLVESVTVELKGGGSIKAPIDS